MEEEKGARTRWLELHETTRRESGRLADIRHLSPEPACLTTTSRAFTCQTEGDTAWKRWFTEVLEGISRIALENIGRIVYTTREPPRKQAEEEAYWLDLEQDTSLCRLYHTKHMVQLGHSYISQ